MASHLGLHWLSLFQFTFLLFIWNGIFHYVYNAGIVNMTYLFYNILCTLQVRLPGFFLNVRILRGYLFSVWSIISQFTCKLSQISGCLKSYCHTDKMHKCISPVHHTVSPLPPPDNLICLFVWFDSLHPINNPSVNQGRIFLGWTSTNLG